MHFLALQLNELIEAYHKIQTRKEIRNVNFPSDAMQAFSLFFFFFFAQFKKTGENSLPEKKTNSNNVFSFRTGLIKDDSWYENVQIDVSKKKCLYTKRKPDSSWQVICNKNDEDCLGTSNCNPIKCSRKKKKLQTDIV